jgi:hypothetical protein
MSENRYPNKKYEHLATIYATNYLKSYPKLSPTEFAKKYLEIEKEIRSALSKPMDEPQIQVRTD